MIATRTRPVVRATKITHFAVTFTLAFAFAVSVVAISVIVVVPRTISSITLVAITSPVSVLILAPPLTFFNLALNLGDPLVHELEQFAVKLTALLILG